jgi:hypothetical protein
VTVYANKAPLLAKIYDELIVAVEGYAVGGQPLEGAERIRKEMDMFHKVGAVTQLFEIPDGEDAEVAA